MKTVNFKYGGHKWEKQNLVTRHDRNGFFDEYQCKCCGIVGKSYTMGIIDIPDRYFENGRHICTSKSSKVKVKFCTAHGEAFANMTPGSIHEIIKPPQGQNAERGEWVMGCGEPVLLLWQEFEYVEEDTDNQPKR